MLIPVGLEKNEVRRHPWVSYAIIAINVAVFLALWLEIRQSTVPMRAREKLIAAEQYLAQHPYLNTPPELEGFLRAADRERLARSRADYLRRTGAPVEWATRRQQQELNTMAAELISTVREFPTMREGFVPADPDPIRILTSMFVHAGWMHLIGNMLFFFAAAPFLEDVYGRVLFILLYLLSGGAALATHVWQNPASLAPYVGASGAIAGVLGAFLVRFARTRMRFVWVPIPPLFWWRLRVVIPAFVFLPLWFLTQFWLATTSEGSGVALWAHVGGFAFGVVFALVVWATGVEKRFIHPAIESQIGWNQNAGLVQAIEAAQRGDVEKARRETERVLREDPRNIDARRYAYEVAVDSRDWKEAGVQASRLLELYLQRGEEDLARSLIEESLQMEPDELPMRFQLRAADFFARCRNTARALELYELAARTHPTDQGVIRALLSAADLYSRDGRFGEARKACERARSHPSLSAEWATLLEQKLAALDQAATGYRGTQPTPRPI